MTIREGDTSSSVAGIVISYKTASKFDNDDVNDEDNDN